MEPEKCRPRDVKWWQNACLAHVRPNLIVCHYPKEKKRKRRKKKEKIKNGALW